MANKYFLYKVYKRSRITANQRIFDGSFEGFDNTNYATYWTGAGTPTIAERSRLHAYPNDTLGSAIQLDGLTGYITSSNLETLSIPNAISFSLWWNKPNWSDGTQQTLIDCLSNFFGQSGLRVDLNIQTAGKMTFGVWINSTFTTVQYLTSSITSGLHHLGFSTDGRYVAITIDGVQVALTDRGSVGSVSVQSGEIKSAHLYFGASLSLINGRVNSFASGIVDDIAVYGAFLSTAQFLQIYNTKNPLSANIGFHYPLDAGAGTFELADNSSTFGCAFVGGATWVTGYMTTSRSAYVQTSVSGSTAQGIKPATGKECAITGGATYTASAFVLAAAGETITLVLTPTGAGSPQSISILASGSWQKIVSTYVSSVGATKLAVQVQIENATASVKSLFVDRVALNDGTIAYDYFDQFTPNSGGNIYGYNFTLSTNTATFTTYQYIDTWSGVASDPSYDQEINNAGSQLEVTLARDPTNFGERYDVDLGLDVRIIAVDDQAPNGTQIFNGYITGYTPDFVAGCVKVMLFSYGAEFDQFESQAGSLLTGQMPINNGTRFTGFYTGYTAIPVNPQTTFQLSQMFLTIGASSTGGVVPMLYQGSPAGDQVNVNFGLASYSTTNPLIAMANPTSFPIGSPVRTAFNFPSNPTLYAGNSYYILLPLDAGTGQVTIAGATNPSDASAIANYPPFGVTYYADGNSNNVSYGMVKNTAFSSPTIELWQPTGSTTVVFNSVDPGMILRTAMADYSAQGGNVNFDASSIALTNTLVSYTFIAASVLDVINKCLQLAPPNWYWYVDHSTRKLYFKQKDVTPKHFFEIGTHFPTLSFEKRMDNMVNTVYLTGGQVGATNLYKKYSDAASVAIYGQKMKAYNDSRITVMATANTIANTLIEEGKAPEVRATIEVADSYDIEIIRPGDMVTFRNTGTNSDFTSLWDVGFWDEMYWDYDLSNPGTLILQIARMTYKPDSVATVLSTVPPDVNKRIEDINRALEAQQTALNPTVPTV